MHERIVVLNGMEDQCFSQNSQSKNIIERKRLSYLNGWMRLYLKPVLKYFTRK